MSRLTHLGRACWRAGSLPPALAHELTHLVLALPFATTVALVFDGGDAGLRVDWRDGAPQWGIVLAAYGPLIVGSLVGVTGCVALVVGGPPALADWPRLGLLAVWWAIYVMPSADDRATAADSVDGS